MIFNKNFIVLLLLMFALCSFVNSEKNEKILFDLKQNDITILKSLVNPKTINEVVNLNYDLIKPVKSSLLSIGVNDIYLVETQNKKYVLRLSRVEKYLTLSASEFLFELEWLDFLKDHDVPVSYPIRRLDNQFCGLIQSPEGPRYSTLFSYAEGRANMNIEQAFVLGKSLAKLHIVSDSFETTLNRAHLNLYHLIECPLRQIKEFLGETCQNQCDYLDELAEELTKQISNVKLAEGSYGIIGGDVHGYNQHFTEGNQVTMFDFEFCAYGYRMYDLATFKWGRCSNNPALWDAFLNGYQSIRKVSNEEIQSIDVFVKARNLWWMGSMTTLPEYRYKLDNKFWDRAFSRFHEH